MRRRRARLTRKSWAAHFLDGDLCHAGCQNDHRTYACDRWVRRDFRFSGAQPLNVAGDIAAPVGSKLSTQQVRGGDMPDCWSAFRICNAMSAAGPAGLSH